MCICRFEHQYNKEANKTFKALSDTDVFLCSGWVSKLSFMNHYQPPFGWSFEGDPFP